MSSFSIQMAGKLDAANGMRALFLVAAACLALLTFAFHHALGRMLVSWQTEEYSHCFIIPFIALLIAWSRLAWTPLAVRPSLVGSAILATGISLLVVGEFSTFTQLAEFGYLVALVGLFESFLGGRALRIAAPAFIYLLFAVPLPAQMLASLSLNLQILSSDIGVSMLDMVGVAVFQDGNIINLAGYQLQVTEACSGLRYLFPLMSFGFLIAYMFEASAWKRIVVFVSSVPITIVMNSLRIAFTGVTVDRFGIEAARGFLHAFEGWAVFMACTAILLAEVWVLARITGRGRLRLELFSVPPALRLSLRQSWLGPAGGVLAISLVAALLVGSNVIGERVELVPPHRSLAQFPLAIGDWYGRPQTLEPEILTSLAMSDHWIADYAHPDMDDSVNLMIAYYDSQRMGSSAHSPSTCIPGGGWKIVDDQEMMIDFPDAKVDKLKIERLTIKLGDQTQIVYYWFAERGRDITSQGLAKWYLFWDSITTHRSDGALIRLVSPLSPDESATIVDDRMRQFLLETLPKLKEFLPTEMAVDQPDSAKTTD